jgi:EmrB/QacA subfamily drug resistance transporter
MTDSQQAQGAPSRAAEEPFVWTGRHTLILVVICAASILDTIDISALNVALPTIKAELGFTEASLSWVVNGYLVTFGGFLLLFGRAGDVFGHRRVLLAGLAVFGVASAVAGITSDANTLIAMRALQGIGAAMITPMTLALVARSFPEGPRAKAIAVWGMTNALSGFLALVLGGVLTVGPGWRWIFFINVPLSVLIIIGTLVWLDRDRAPERRKRLDLVGAVVATLGMSLLTIGIVQAGQSGWGATATIVPLVLGVLFVAYFVLHEGRLAKDPMLPFSLLKIPTVAGANLTQALVGAGMFVLTYVATLYQQDVLHYNALQTGLGYIPQTVVLLAAAQQTPKLVAKLGVRVTVMIGSILVMIGLGSFAFAGPDGSYLVNILGPYIVIGVGMALTFLPLSLAAGIGVPDERQGVASSLINVSRVTGGALGLSVVAAVAASYTSSRLEAGTPEVTALTDGFHVGFIVAAGLLLVSVFTAMLLPRKPADVPAEAT